MARTPKNSHSKTIIHKSNGWAMLENVLVRSIDKGQLPIAGVILIIVILVMRMPEERAYQLVVKILELASNWSITGWILGFIGIFGWIYSTKRLRRLHTYEIRRLSDERTKLQEELIKRNLPTSN